MSYTQSVIKEIRQKTPTGFSGPIYIGPEQKYVSALLNSHNNNLEEQFILGTDCLIVSWEDGDVKYITKKFFDSNTATVSPDGYYILFIADYSDSLMTADFYFRNNELYLPDFGKSSATFEQISGTDDYNLKCDSLEIYFFDNATQSFKISPSYRVIREETLCLRKNISSISDEQINTDIIISKKVITQTVNAQNKTYTKEIITNYLS